MRLGQKRRNGTGWHSLALISCFLTLSLLSACGFHLRGSELSRLPALPPVYVQGDAGAYHALFLELRRALERTGTQLVSDAAQAQRIIVIYNEVTNRRVLSVGSTGKVKEYELHYAATFSVQDHAGQTLLAPQTISLTRPYVFDEARVMAKDTEAEMLFENMRTEAAQQIVRRLQMLVLPEAGATPSESAE